MNSSRPFLTLCTGVGLCVLSLTAWSQIKPKEATVSEIKDYTSWHQVARERVEMAPAVAAMCASASMSRRISVPVAKGKFGPHAKKYIRVFVNEIGDEQMTGEKHPRFPVGSVIVKQKLPVIKAAKGSKIRPQQISSTPELLTVMIKREAGYDAANGDWEYMVTDGEGKKVTERGKIELCQGCHRAYSKTDYIVRSYLPKGITALPKSQQDDSVGSEDITIQ